MDFRHGQVDAPPLVARHIKYRRGRRPLPKVEVFQVFKTAKPQNRCILHSALYGTTVQRYNWRQLPFTLAYRLTRGFAPSTRRVEAGASCARLAASLEGHASSGIGAVAL